MNDAALARAKEITSQKFKKLDFDEKVEWVKKLLVQNEKDLTTVKTDFKTQGVQAQAISDYMRTQRLLEEQLELLTGKKTMSVEDIADAGGTPPPKPPKDGDDKPKEKVTS